MRELEERLGGEEWYAVTNHGRIPVGRGYEGMEKDGHMYYEDGDSAQCNVCTPTQFSMDCTGIDKKLVMFDDMSYTGIQAAHTLGQFKQGSVIFVCPYKGLRV